MRFLIFSLISFCCLHTHAQQKFTISGYVKDSLSGETLIQATVFVEELGRGAATNEYGFYSLTLPEGSYHLQFNYLGYKTKNEYIKLGSDLRLNIDLRGAYVETKEVVITGEKKDANVSSTDMGRQELKIEQTKAIPALLGEVDIIKAIQLLPGIQSSGEGNTGFYVRGGGPDQNLVLLDDAVVYNTGHLFGFFSVFNADAVKNTTIIKGGMPASYGGRISSVLDISMKEGNMKKYEIEGGIGLISSRLTIQGPIKKDKASFIISARRTYIDLLLKPFLKNLQGGQFAGNEYYFYDINAKLNYRFSDKDRIYVSGYFGRDVFNFRDPSGSFKLSFPWGNTTATLRWNHLFSDKLFLNTMLIYNDFKFSANTNFQDVNFNLNSSVREATAKLDFDYSPLIGHRMQFGAQYNYHIFTPYQASGNAGSTEFSSTSTSKKHAHETSIYFQDDFDATRWLRINAGLRGSMFNFVGPFNKLVFNERGQVTDTLDYKANQHIQTYFGIEPRISARFQTGKTSSVKLGFSVNYQYIHLVSSSTTTLPIDLWIPSTQKVKPQIGLQYALGYFRNFKDNMFETSVEVYYKDMRNQIEYGESAVPQIQVDVEDLFTFGRGYSYGAEFFFKKTTGKFTGWIGYTLAWTWRKFPEINNGQAFRARYDRRHDLSVVAIYDINKNWRVSATFVFATGQATTLPVSYFLHEGQARFVYGSRNFYRLPAYHRMDVGFTYIIPRKKYYSDITVSVYNLYNRMNPFFVFVDADGDAASGDISLKAKQSSLFPIIPSITWNFKFSSKK